MQSFVFIGLRDPKHLLLMSYIFYFVFSWRSIDIPTLTSSNLFFNIAAFDIL